MCVCSSELKDMTERLLVGAITGNQWLQNNWAFAQHDNHFTQKKISQ